VISWIEEKWIEKRKENRVGLNLNNFCNPGGGMRNDKKIGGKRSAIKPVQTRGSCAAFNKSGVGAGERP